MEKSLMKIDQSTIPQPNPEAIGRIVDREAVIVLPQKGKVKVLNEVGAAIWDLIDGQRSIQEINESICQQFDVDSHTVEVDTIKFISDLVEKEIVHI